MRIRNASRFPGEFPFTILSKVSKQTANYVTGIVVLANQDPENTIIPFKNIFKIILF